MKNSQKYPLEKLIHVNEFKVGGIEEEKQGRRYDTKKQKAFFALEFTDNYKVKNSIYQVY